MNIEGVNIVVKKEYQFVTYIYIGSFVFNILGELICKKKILSIKRSVIFLLFIILGVSISPMLNDWNLFFTFVVLFSCLDIIAILLKMLSDSKMYQHRLQNMTLPVNQFTKKRKLVSRIVMITSFTVFFVICFVVFYFNEVSLTALLELLFVGIVIATISQIISSSVSLSPLNKYIKQYNKTLYFNALEKKLLEYEDDNIHPETKNLINIVLWKCAIFYDKEAAKKYENLVFMPKSEDNIGKYYDAFFWNLLFNEKYDLILASEKNFKKYAKKKKEVCLFISLIKNEKNVKCKIKVKDKVSEIKSNLAKNWR